jgi:hypothetical protein
LARQLARPLSCAAACTDNPVSRICQSTNMKTYDIEIQRLKSARHHNGLIELGVELLVMPRPARDEQSVTSCLSLPIDDARTLMLLLKQQITEVDKLQPRSRRSGRC